MIPTPTPWVIGPNPYALDLPDMRMWGWADDAIAVWNRAGPQYTDVIQVVVIAVIVLAGLMIVWRSIRALMKPTPSGETE